MNTFWQRGGTANAAQPGAKENAGDHIPKEISLSRNDLSGMTGAAVEPLVHLLQKFQAEGLIEVQGRKILIPDAKLMESIANNLN